MGATLQDIVRERKNTKGKEIYFTEEGLAVLSGWAKEKGVSFSAAVEGLALLGLDDERFETLVPLMSTLLEQVLNRQFNRLVRLLFLTAESADQAYQMSATLMLHRLREMAEANPTGFESELAISKADPLGERIWQMQETIKGISKERARKRLKKPLQVLLGEEWSDADC